MKKRLFIVVNDVLPLLDTRAAEGNNTVVGTEPNLKKYDKETAMKNLPEMEAAFEFPQTKEYLDKLGIVYKGNEFSKGFQEICFQKKQCTVPFKRCAILVKRCFGGSG